MPNKPIFTPALFRFLTELRLHNDRDWFERNRERYLRDVRDPMLRFVAEFAPTLRRIAPRLLADPRPAGGSLFRIHRDTRFSRDKTPYKTNVAAHFRHEAGRDVHGPGLFLERTAAWKRVTAAPAMRGLEWWGESLKRTPRGLPQGHPLDALLRRKDFGAGVTLAPRDALSPRFPERVAEVYRALVPTLKLLAEAVQAPW
jgi:uncharacterized protein (DUF2461 family)